MCAVECAPGPTIRAGASLQPPSLHPVTDPSRLLDPARLAALDRTGLLDSPAEATFDRVRDLVCHLLGVPAATVTLVAAERQVYKSHRGLPEPWASRGQTPLSHSLCRFVVEDGAPLAVADIRADARLCGTLAGPDLGVVGYLGVPLRTPDGHVLGTLCAVATAPRAWTPADAATMTGLAGIVETEIALREAVAARDRLATTLRGREAQFREMTEAAPQLVWTADAAGAVTYVNARWTAFTGTGAGGWAEAIHPDDREATRALWAEALAGGQPFEAECRFRHAESGLFRWFITRAEPLHEAGAAARWFGSCTDIHDLRVAQRGFRDRSERLRLVQVATRDIVWDLDIRDNAIEWSAAGVHCLGWGDLGSVTDVAWWTERVHPEDRARVEHSFHVFVGGSAGDAWREAYRFERADGTYAFILDSGTLVRDADGAPTRAVGCMADLSERKTLEDELVVARETAEAASRLKSTLLANMSHEIRTPLTAILGYAELLSALVPENLMPYTDTIQRGGERLLETLNSVLDLAQIESGQYRIALAPLDLRDEARATCAALQPLADARGLALRAEGTAALALADRPAVGRVLTNLVGNAIKFTARGHVVLRVGVEDGQAVLRVSDTGPGISAVFLPHLFAEFKQESEGHTRTHEGNGLAHAITRRLVEMMGGTIAAASEPGRGSTFTVRLPLADVVPARAAPVGPAGFEPATVVL